MKILAIDQGTTSTRGLVVDENANAKLVYSKAHQQHYPHTNWVEHNPKEILSHIKEAIDAAGKIDAIGIANQGESCMAWDAKTCEPLSPILVWQDDRTAEFIEQNASLTAVVNDKANLPLESYFSATKLGWLMSNNEAVQKAHQQKRLRLGTTDAWFIQSLTGHCATDISTASRTMLLNAQTLKWDADLCEAFSIPIDALPQIKPTVGELGIVKTAIAETPILASVVDQQAALYGHGCLQAGDTKMTFGTGAFALGFTDEQRICYRENAPIPTVAWGIANQTKYAIDGGIFAASSAVNWAKSLGLFKDLEGINSFQSESAYSQGIFFVPALYGLGCPHWDRNAAGAWLGLKGDTNADLMVQAVLEGIAFRMAEITESFKEHISIRGAARVDGGLAKNPYFLQSLSNITQLELFCPEEVEQTAIGVARLAAVAMHKEIAINNSGQTIKPKADCEKAREQFTRAVKLTQSFHTVRPD